MNRKLLVNGAFWGGAKSVLVEGGQITALDVTDASAESVDLAGRRVFPGFIDAHLHAFWLGAELSRAVDLAGSTTVAEALDRIRRWAPTRPPGDWVLGRGYDQEKVVEKRWPTPAELSQASGGKPTVITRVCGHAGAVSSDLSNGGAGLLVEHDLWNLLQKIPPLDTPGLEKAALTTLNLCVSRGLAAISSMLEELRQLDVLVNMGRTGKLPIPVTANFPGREMQEVARRGWTTGTTFGNLRVGAAKFFSDGSMGARTAFLSQPFSDDPSTKGLELISREDMTSLFRQAHDLGFQIAVHAIGDQAIRNVLAALRPVCTGGNPRRHRVEHFTLCPQDCIQEAADLNIVGVIQPQFITSDSWLKHRLGERMKDAYPFRRLCDAGVPLSLSSDAPVESIDPVACLREATTGPKGLTFQEAITAYTQGSAHAAGLDDMGAISVGKRAVFSVETNSGFELLSYQGSLASSRI